MDEPPRADPDATDMIQPEDSEQAQVLERETHEFTYQGKTYERKKRKPLTKEKRQRLEEAFRRKEVPRGRHGSAAKKRLANELGLSVREVHKWFDNRRTKESLLEKRLFNQMTGEAKGLNAVLEKPEEPIPLPPPDRKKRKAGTNLSNLWDNKVDISKPVGKDVTSHFRLINRFFEGAFDLAVDRVGAELLDDVQDDAQQGQLSLPGANGSQPDLPGEPQIDPETGVLRSNRKRKPKVAPTLQNVVEVAFSQDACFHPLIEAVEVLSAEGYLEALIRRVLHEPANLRSFLMWYAIGKHSGDRTVGAVIRSFMNGLAPAIHRVSLAEVVESQIPELIEGGVDARGNRAAHAINRKYALFSNDSAHDLHHRDTSHKWMSDFLNKLFVGRKVVHRKQDVIQLQPNEEDSVVYGDITKVLAPTSRHPHEPRFRVYYQALDIATTVSWRQIQQAFPMMGTVEPEPSQQPL